MAARKPLCYAVPVCGVCPHYRDQNFHGCERKEGHKEDTHKCACGYEWREVLVAIP